MKKIAIFAFVATAPLLVACGSAAVPADRLASSEAAIRSAREIGAENNPTAALHLRLAREQVNVARKLIADGDNERAESVLRRAEADAEVAIALTKESLVKADAQRALEEVRSLRSKSISGTKEGA